MIDALRMTKEGDRIEIFFQWVGNCERPPGDVFDANDMHRGLQQWKFGATVVEVSLDAQGGASKRVWIHGELLKSEQSDEPRVFDGDLFKRMASKYVGILR